MDVAKIVVVVVVVVVSAATAPEDVTMPVVARYCFLIGPDMLFEHFEKSAA